MAESSVRNHHINEVPVSISDIDDAVLAQKYVSAIFDLLETNSYIQKKKKKGKVRHEFKHVSGEQTFTYIISLMRVSKKHNNEVIVEKYADNWENKKEFFFLTR